MERSMYDTRPWLEVVGDLVDFESEYGDSIKVTVKYNDFNKPQVIFRVNKWNSDPKDIEITSFLPETPNFKLNDESRGYDTWKEFFNDPAGFGPMVQSVIRGAGRNFEYEEIK